ncbi:tetraacyldisaccharide 4'-kinase [Comamonadaceae bacterium OH2545_COT-014]|nr:tetraacyldisaccharide 4'-kinase [Comamonadaceae bacterium OH2545_COT-014]
MRPATRAALEQALLAAWQRRGPLAVLLWPLSQVYRALAAWQRARQRRRQRQAGRLPVPVIVVGNVIAGGAGKTPVTLAVVQHLQARGFTPGIVSRGHGRQGQGCAEARPGSAPQAVGDEPLLLRRRTGAPVFVARRRMQAARALLAAYPQVNVLVCDDGLQHLALPRDIEIVVFDERGTGNGWLLPAGPLREPWPRPLPPRGAAAPAVLALHTAPAGHAPPAGAAPGAFHAPRALADHALRADGQRVPLAQLRGQPLTAVAGIARPQAFFSMLRAAGLRLGRTVALPDHYDFSSFSGPIDGPEALICTEKDAAKLWPRAPAALAVPLRLDVPAAFFHALDGHLAQSLAARGQTVPLTPTTAHHPP